MPSRCVRRDTAVQQCDEVDIGIVRSVVAQMIADLQHKHILIGAVLQMVAIRIVCLEAGGIAGAQNFGAVIGHQRNFA